MSFMHAKKRVTTLHDTSANGLIRLKLEEFVLSSGEAQFAVQWSRPREDTTIVCVFGERFLSPYRGSPNQFGLAAATGATGRA